MNLATIRFAGHTWHHNPKEIKLYCDSSVTEQVCPYDKAVLQNFGRKNRIIKGTGELYGVDCLTRFDQLFNLYSKGATGILSIPDLPPFFAQMTYLALIGQPCEQVITYSFEFVECMQTENTLVNDKVKYHTVLNADETLWNIAQGYGIPVDRLVELNPWIRLPDELSVGQRVVLV